jgi:hypothetical protein
LLTDHPLKNIRINENAHLYTIIRCVRERERMQPGQGVAAAVRKGE